MLSPAPIELGAVRIRQFECVVALGIGETLPQGHSKFGTVTGRQLEEFRQGTRRHVPIVARSARCRQFEQRILPTGGVSLGCDWFEGSGG